MRLLLDTNAYSALMRGHREVAARIRQANRVLVSPIVAAELLLGFRLGRRFEENSARFEAFLANPYVESVPITQTTADRFARIAVALRAKGRPIPTNDLWIAAQVVETGADLLSADTHFAEIEGLAWIPFSQREEDTIRERVRRYYAGESPE
jgi:tRNA(fMet)-specific endonuclease VapC